jgi:GMP synthase (glutamine-hydrolysing)
MEGARQAVFELGVPVLGICYGMQTMAQQLGGKVESSGKREFGYAEMRARGHSKLFDGIQDRDQRRRPRPARCVDEPRRQGHRAAPGLQDHRQQRIRPDRRHGRRGARLLRRAVPPRSHAHHQGQARSMPASCTTSAAAGDWNMPDYVEEAIEKVREQVGKEEVILGLSGGVDSSVAAALLHRAIGDQLTCVFVDNGLLRLNEGEQVMEMFARNLGVKVIHVDATEQFMGHLKGVSDPEQKRKIIGREFVEVFQAEAPSCPTPGGWPRAPSIPT